MESAFSFGKAFLDERASARRRRFTRIERLARLGLRDSARGAGSLAAYRGLVRPSTTTGALRKSSWRTARSRRPAGARRTARSRSGAHTLRRARSLPLIALAGLRRGTRRRKSLAAWRMSRRRGRSRSRRTLRGRSAGLSGSRVRCTTRSRTRSRWTQWHARSRASSGGNCARSCGSRRRSGRRAGSSRGTRRRNNARANSAGSGSRRSAGSSSGGRGGSRSRCGSGSRRYRRGRWTRRSGGSRRRSGACRLFRSSLRRFSGSFGSGEILKMLAREFRMLDVDRARVRFLFFDADLGQVVDQYLGFDLEFPREFVDPDLISV
jgi:hypothetical protein